MSTFMPASTPVLLKPKTRLSNETSATDTGKNTSTTAFINGLEVHTHALYTFDTKRGDKFWRGVDVISYILCLVCLYYLVRISDHSGFGYVAFRYLRRCHCLEHPRLALWYIQYIQFIEDIIELPLKVQWHFKRILSTVIINYSPPVLTVNGVLYDPRRCNSSMTFSIRERLSTVMNSDIQSCKLRRATEIPTCPGSNARLDIADVDISGWGHTHFLFGSPPDSHKTMQRNRNNCSVQWVRL